MRWEKSELTHPTTGNSQYKNRRKYSFTNLKIYHAYEISTLTKMTKMQASEIEQLDNKFLIVGVKYRCRRF